MAKSKRLDELVLERGLATSRSEAKALIMAGRVRHGTERLSKPGSKVPAQIELTLEQGPRFVSRGGEKLLGFIERFGLTFQDCSVLDIGSSTGGFTDCALQHGASSATCVDVGKGQLHAKIRNDAKVHCCEKVNARHLQKGDLPFDAYERIVIDVSFISLRLILPAVWPFLREAGVLVALVKPQFEVGKAVADKYRGVIKDEQEREAAFASVREFALSALHGASELGCMLSPIRGADGNVEYLLGLNRNG